MDFPCLAILKRKYAQQRFCWGFPPFLKMKSLHSDVVLLLFNLGHNTCDQCNAMIMYQTSPRVNPPPHTHTQNSVTKLTRLPWANHHYFSASPTQKQLLIE